MPRLSLPREAPRVLIQRDMPSKQFDHSYCVNTGVDYIGDGGVRTGGIIISNASYTDAIHNQYFVNTNWSIECMFQANPNSISSDIFLLTDRAWRYGNWPNTTPGLGILAGNLGGYDIRYGDNTAPGTARHGGGSMSWGRGIWVHLVITFNYNAADPLQSVLRTYVDGYKYDEIIMADWMYPINNTQFGKFYSLYKQGNIEICGGTWTAFKFFRMISSNPWPVNGFEIASSTQAFTGSGVWKPGINDPQPYPTIDPSIEIMKFNFQTTMALSDIRDLSPNQFQVESIAPNSKIKYISNNNIKFPF